MSELVLVLQGECDKHYGSEFVFEIHAKELIVGDIYVRIYNEQPTFPLEVSTSTISDIEIGVSFIDYTFVNNDTLVLFPESKGLHYWPVGLHGLPGPVSPFPNDAESEQWAAGGSERPAEAGGNGTRGAA